MAVVQVRHCGGDSEGRVNRLFKVYLLMGVRWTKKLCTLKGKVKGKLQNCWFKKLGGWGCHLTEMGILEEGSSFLERWITITVYWPC